MFDGECALCDRSVAFIAHTSAAGTFAYAPRESAHARDALAAVAPAAGVDGLMLIDGGQVYARSDAALRIARRLRGPWRLLAAFGIVPRSLRDAAYDVIARNRYRWFGRHRSG